MKITKCSTQDSLNKGFSYLIGKEVDVLFSSNGFEENQLYETISHIVNFNDRSDFEFVKVVIKDVNVTMIHIDESSILGIDLIFENGNLLIPFEDFENDLTDLLILDKHFKDDSGYMSYESKIEYFKKEKEKDYQRLMKKIVDEAEWDYL
jgi:hypothetical protein